MRMRQGASLDGIKTPSVPAVDKALSALELLAQSRCGLTLGELTRRMALPKSSVHCLLLTLERRGYLHRNAKSRYLFGLKLFGLANMALSGIVLREKALPFLKALMARTRLTVHLALLEQGEAVLIEKVGPPNVFKLATWLGKRMDVHCTGVGKALMAHLPESEVEALVRDHGLPRHNENTICSLRRLRDELERVRTAGYALDDEEDELGARCVGAPIFDAEGKAIAAISASGPTGQLTSENVVAIAGQVKECAATITAVLA
jgi:DNA-binding IclR family transcriptional regulator